MVDKINTEHGVFTSNEVTGETAEEVYNKWLENKDKTPQKLPTELDYLIDLDYRLSMMELGL